MSVTAMMYRVDPTEVGWRAHRRRFVMGRSCAGGIAYVLRSTSPRGFHGFFSKHPEQHELGAVVGEPRAHTLTLGERQCLGDSFVAGPECELLGSRWCPKHEDHTWLTTLPANDNIVLVR